MITQLQNGSIDLIGPESTTSVWRDMVVASESGDWQLFVVPSTVWEHIDLNLSLSLMYQVNMPVVLRQ